MPQSPPVASDFESLRDEFRAAFEADRGGIEFIGRALERLQRTTSARAVGLWKRTGGELLLVGFRAVAEMPHGVQSGFSEATRSVRLTETGFGIVQAVVSNQPALATLDPDACGLPGSSSWVARFEARCSVAMPVHHDGEVVGAIALATANDLAPGDAVWKLLEQLAEILGEGLSHLPASPSLD
jgi:GAF domain-containing protein